MNELKTKEDWNKIKEGDFISTGIIFGGLNNQGELIGSQQIWEIFSNDGKWGAGTIKVRGYFLCGEEMEKIVDMPQPQKQEMFLLDEEEKKKVREKVDMLTKMSIIQSLK